MEIEKILEYFEALVVTQKLVDLDYNLIFKFNICINRDKEIVRKSLPKSNGVRFLTLCYERYEENELSSLYLEIHTFKERDEELINYLKDRSSANVLKYEEAYIDFKIEFNSFDELASFFSNGIIHYI